MGSDVYTHQGQWNNNVQFKLDNIFQMMLIYKLYVAHTVNPNASFTNVLMIYHYWKDQWTLKSLILYETHFYPTQQYQSHQIFPSTQVII